MVPLVYQFWMDSDGYIQYGVLPDDYIQSPTDFLFWDWYHGEVVAGRIPPDKSIPTLKMWWHNNVFSMVVPERDQVDEGTMDMIAMLMAMYGNHSVEKSSTVVESHRYLTTKELTEQAKKKGLRAQRDAEKLILEAIKDIGADVTDTENVIQVTYEGILPDLFREGQGIVATGKLINNNMFFADEVLAKHDENYMPPEVADTLKKAGVTEHNGNELK